MPPNLSTDEKLLEEALKVSGLKTKKSAVNAALKEFIEKRKQKDILTLFGKKAGFGLPVFDPENS